MSAFSFGPGAFLNCTRSKVEPEMATAHTGSAGRGYRERNRGRVPPWSAILLKCLSMLEVSLAHHGHQQIVTTTAVVSHALHQDPPSLSSSGTLTKAEIAKAVLNFWI